MHANKTYPINVALPPPTPESVGIPKFKTLETTLRSCLMVRFNDVSDRVQVFFNKNCLFHQAGEFRTGGR